MSVDDTDADGTLSEAGQVLAGYFTRFDVDPRLLRQILDSDPGLAGQAARCGWSDTGIREGLADLLAQALLQRPWPAYPEAGDDPGFGEDLRRAHDAWVRAQDARPSGDAYEGYETRAVDEILGRRPLQLPRQMADGSDAAAVYRSLGIRLLGRPRRRAVTIPVELPGGWACQRAGSRWIKVCDQAGQAVLKAFYKLIPPVPRTFAQLTAPGADLVRQGQARRRPRIPGSIWQLGRHPDRARNAGNQAPRDD